jgi:hypothetical protein
MAAGDVIAGETTAGEEATAVATTTGEAAKGEATADAMRGEVEACVDAREKVGGMSESRGGATCIAGEATRMDGERDPFVETDEAGRELACDGENRAGDLAGTRGGDNVDARGMGKWSATISPHVSSRTFFSILA